MNRAKFILSEAIDVLSLIRAEAGKNRGVAGMSTISHLPKSLAHCDQRMKNHQSRYQIIVLDYFPLFIKNIFSNDSFASIN